MACATREDLQFIPGGKYYLQITAEEWISHINGVNGVKGYLG